MIDVLIVLLIFLMLTTSFRRETGIRIRLPESTAPGTLPARGIEVTIDRDGRVFVNAVAAAESSTDGVKALLAAAAPASDGNVVIRADRRTPHEAVMHVLDAASQLGLARVSFAMASEAATPASPQSSNGTPP